MKFFPEFGSCFGGAPISPAAEVAAADERQTAEQGVYSHRKRRPAKVRPGATATNWKPKLNAISENNPMTEVNRGGRSVLPAGIGNRKAIKVKPRSAPSVDRAEEYYYWSVILIILP